MTDEQNALDAGIVAGTDPDPDKARAYAKEKADVEKWMERVDKTREFDKVARVQYAKDRRYARGDSGFEVDANLIGNYIDIKEAFLYARDPDFDVTPGPAHRMPSADMLRDAIEDMMGEQLAQQSLDAGKQAAAMAVMMGVPPDQAVIQGEQAQLAATEQAIAAELLKLRKSYARKSREMKAFCDTVEVCGSHLWKQARLKSRGRPWVRSALTVGVGILKASWQERTDIAPEHQTAINDLQANLAAARLLQRQLAEGDAGFMARAWDGLKALTGADQDAKVAELERQLQAIQSKAERVIARGLVVDLVAPENFVVAPGYPIANHLDAPWNAEYIYMATDDALAAFGPYLEQQGKKPGELLSKAVRYTPRKPENARDESPSVDNVDAKDAEGYVEGDEGECFVRVVEIWDRNTNAVLTGIQGVPCWVKPSWNPPATTRFYGYFVLPMSEVDGQRHPQSYVTRSAKLVDEYNRIGSAEAEHRRRIRPKMAFNAEMLEKGEAKKLEAGAIGEMIALRMLKPGTPIDQVLREVNYPTLNPALYDRQRIVNELERIWGIQEALSGAVQVAKTATEADIQQQGFSARSSSGRDVLESVLSELAQYTAEISRVYLTEDDVREIAGPSAFWPPYLGPDDLSRWVNIEVRAGSSGKPDTAAQRQAWSTLLPILQASIEKIGALRGASPASVADAMEQLLRITAERSGERFDIDQLIPQGDGAMPAPAAPGQPAQGGPMPPTEEPPGGAAQADPLAA